MEPAALGSYEWNEIGKLLIVLWILVLFVVLFATNIIVGHNMIPSLVASGHLDIIWNRTRPVFYVGALICLGLALFFLSLAVDLAGVLRSFWADYWI